MIANATNRFMSIRQKRCLLLVLVLVGVGGAMIYFASRVELRCLLLLLIGLVVFVLREHPVCYSMCSHSLIALCRFGTAQAAKDLLLQQPLFDLLMRMLNVVFGCKVTRILFDHKQGSLRNERRLRAHHQWRALEHRQAVPLLGL
jgi:hypothetical protein